MKQSVKTVTIGIIGDGQLALMLADALKAQKLPFLCLSTQNNSSMALTYPEQTTSDSSLFKVTCDVFTLENEFLSSKELENLLGEKSAKLFPDLNSYQFFADKISQRTLFRELNIPSPRWMEVTHLDIDLITAAGFSFPFILKAKSGGYDGKGVRIVRNPSDFNRAADDFGFYRGESLLLEEKIKIKKELAQGFVRSSDGQYTLLPLVETVQIDGVCQYVYYPAPVPTTISEQITEAINKLIDFPLVGIFNFEFFVDDQDKIYINEGAPRPHNSQHLTLDASTHSQFELLAMYLSGSQNTPKNVETKKSAMINILGKSQCANYRLSLPEIDSGLHVVSKLYGKDKCSKGRKMGHVNLVDPSNKYDLKIVAEKIFKEYHI